MTPLVAEAVAGQLGSSRYTRIELIDVDPADGESRRVYYAPDDSNVAARPTLTVTYGGTTTSAPAPPPSGGSTLRVLEYNVHHGGIGTDGEYDPNRVVDWIVKMNPDIISLCEMEKDDSYVSTDGVALYQSLLEQKTGPDVVHAGHSGLRRLDGGGDPQCHHLAGSRSLATYRHEFSIGKDRTAGGVTISVNGRTINFASTHLDPDSRPYRTTEATELVSYLTGFAQDRILLGDFNDQPTRGADHRHHGARTSTAGPRRRARASRRRRPTTRTATRATRASTTCSTRAANRT